MERNALETLRNKAQGSALMVQNRPYEYLIRAMLAGIYLGFATIFCLKTVNGMYMNEEPLAGFVAAILFGVALVMIVYGGAELFTGNTMYFAISTLRGYTSVKMTICVWTICFIGNALGGLFFALLMAPTGIIQELGMENWLFTLVEGKMNHTAIEIFFRAILCNWMVCMAIFLPKTLKNEFAQIFTLMLLVSVFFVSSFEHVIANLVSFSLVLVIPHPETITIGKAIHNLIPATIGNIIGGALFMGALYTWLNTKKSTDTKVTRLSTKRSM
ncbi:formate/nitrite transporter family protein [Bacillus sp. FJAT-49732]|uniref:Formate/nitrite transporter family protein n=1 Tax=Lederbergia citrisecunda TaxID=2833583 RepID=A0A942TUQ6_9BACI|nr:formate/nitrite transporter family protein [Lederbergia citrisecunda]MBS4202079.1 formate/nitrite transporter family protein [Lederbergia citrisecunda]